MGQWDMLPAIVWEFQGAVLVAANRASLNFFGVDLGKIDQGDWRDWLHTEDRFSVADAIAFSTALAQRPLRFRRADGAFRRLQITCNALPDRLLCVAADVTDFVADGALSKIALHHRVRNLLATMRSIIGRTRGDGEEVTNFRAHLDGRVGALARVQTFLNSSIDERVDLELLLRDEFLIQSASETQIRIEGPYVRLPEKAADLVSLAFHELATNATKFGALATASGRLNVMWDIREQDGRTMLHVTWREKAAPRTAHDSSHQGFGFELIKRKIPYELSGTGSIETTADGIDVAFGFPLIAPVNPAG